MTDAEKYVAVFRAAAGGMMRPYETQVTLPDGTIGVTAAPQDHHNSSGYNHAQSMAGAFYAIADVFQGIVDAERETEECPTAPQKPPTVPTA